MKIPSLINFKDLVSFTRIFEITPSGTGKYLYLGILFSLGLITACVIWFFNHLIKKDWQNLYAKITGLLATISIIGLVLIALRYQQVPYLGSRLLMDILGLITVFWIIDIVRYRYVTIPEELGKRQKKAEFTKYLPKNYKI